MNRKSINNSHNSKSNNAPPPSNVTNANFQRMRDQQVPLAPPPPPSSSFPQNDLIQSSFGYYQPLSNTNMQMLGNMQKEYELNGPNNPLLFAPPSESQFISISKSSRSRPTSGKINTKNSYPENIGTFNDDEPIVENAKLEKVKSGKSEQYNLQQGLKFEIKPIQKAIKLSSKSSVVIPAMISLSTLDSTSEVKKSEEEIKEEFESRAGVDLVCVIDKSGSMSGEKMSLVQKTLAYMLSLLNENDRISLVTFANAASRITNLMRVSKKNLPAILQAIDSMNAGGGTDINRGMDLAFRVLQDRKYKNSVSSIFLLSDGLDGGAEAKVASSLVALGVSDNFTIHTFGFGADHDPKLMGEIAKLQDGSFYYIEKLEMVDESFVDALGGLFSVIAKEVVIQLKVNRKHPFTDQNIKQTYGNMWQFNSKTSEYTIVIEQLMSGISKEYIFELELPPCNFKIGDHERNAVLMTADLECKNISDEKIPVKRTAELPLTIFNENEVIPPDSEVIDEAVQFNIYRVRGAEVLEEAMKSAENNKFEEGQKQIETYLKDLERAKPVTQNKLQMMVNDLNIAQESCQPKVYVEVGSQRMYNMQKCHMEQRSNNLNGFSNNMYCNSKQVAMNIQLNSLQK